MVKLIVASVKKLQIKTKITKANIKKTLEGAVI